MKRILFLSLIFSSFILNASAQVKGAFTDVFIKKILFPDIPDQVVTYIDSSSFFWLSINTNMVRSFDANNYITTGRSTVEIDNPLAGSPEVISISFRASWSGNVQTILPEIESPGYEELLAREVIEYTSGLATKINIDTLNSLSQWKPKYRYEISYANGKVASLKYYTVNSSGFYLFNEAYYTYKNGKVDSYTNSVYEPGYPKETFTGRYHYNGSRLDSLLDLSSTGDVANKFVPTYGSSGNIQTIEHFANVFGLTSIGKSYYYGQNISALNEKSSFENILVTNPVKDFLDIKSETALDIEISDLSGNILALSKTGERINLSQFSQGLYLLTIKGIYGQTVRKILKD